MQRRTLLKAIPISALGLLFAQAGINPVRAADKTVSLAFPFDVESWDPTSRVIPHATSLYKCVFDQPLDYAQDTQLRAGVVTAYEWLDDDGLKLALDFRDDVYFHNGDKLTSSDFRYTFFERPKANPNIQLGYIWDKIQEVETPTPTRAVIHLKAPFVTAPQYLGFAGSFILSEKYIKTAGEEAFLKNPVGTGPYKLVDYQPNNRIVLEAFENYWGGKPEIQHLTIQVIQNPTSRVSATQSGQVAFSYALPIRETVRLGKLPDVTSALTSTVDTYLIQMVNIGPLKDQNVRLAMHHAIDKKALSQALLNGVSAPISTASPPGTPAYQPDYAFPYDPQKAIAYLAKSGYGPDNPVAIKFFSTNGVQPADFQMARAIAQMWKKVGIAADLQVIDMGKYFQASAAGELEGPVLWLWTNSTADPELYSGSYLDAETAFSVWRSEDVMQKLRPLLTELDYDKRVAGYRDFNRWAVEQGYSLPLLQGISSVAHASRLHYQPYQNGWMLPAKWTL